MCWGGGYSNLKQNLLVNKALDHDNFHNYEDSNNCNNDCNYCCFCSYNYNVDNLNHMPFGAAYGFSVFSVFRTIFNLGYPKAGSTFLNKSAHYAHCNKSCFKRPAEDSTLAMDESNELIKLNGLVSLTKLNKLHRTKKEAYV